MGWDGVDGGNLRWRSQIATPLVNVGPISRILNQTCPEPSNDSTLSPDGAFAMYLTTVSSVPFSPVQSPPGYRIPQRLPGSTCIDSSPS